MDDIRILFICNDVNIPTGGIRILYRHVDVLNKHGIKAFIVHGKKGFRCEWFENNTKIMDASMLKANPKDIIVLSEVYLHALFNKCLNFKKVIFNMNCYYTFSDGYSLDNKCTENYYLHPSVLATLVLSEDSKEYIKFSMPELQHIWRVRPSINLDIFNYSSEKKKIISFMPRKHKEDALQVINILKSRNELKDFEIIPIEKKTETDVASILKESLIFLSFGYPEGFGLPPAEAMACGCIVIGYHGGGGKEFFDNKFTYPVHEGKIIEFAVKVENVLSELRCNPDSLKNKALMASQFISKTYSPKMEEIEILNVWENIIKKL